VALIENEWIKLLANALDRASTSYFTVGFVGPLVAVCMISVG